jgi:hypothetical protein
MLGWSLTPSHSAAARAVAGHAATISAAASTGIVALAATTAALGARAAHATNQVIRLCHPQAT